MRPSPVTMLLMGMAGGAEGMLLVPMQADLGLTTSMMIIIILILTLFVIPVICKIIHIIKVQIQKIKNSDLWGAADGNNDDDEDDDEY